MPVKPRGSWSGSQKRRSRI